MRDTDVPILGIGLRVLSGLLFAGMVICVKAVSEEVHWAKSFFSLRFCADPARCFSLDAP